MADYSKGEWGFRRPYENELYSAIVSGGVLICLLPEPHFMPDCGDTTWYNGRVEVMKGNANLIVAAVNSCASVNRDNPQAVAESIEDMYKTLEEIYENREHLPTSIEALVFKTLAKADGKEVH